MIVCKFGGSSVASLSGAVKIKEIANKNKNRKIIVVSALGKCEEYNFKITDKLFELYYLINNGLPYMEILEIIFFRYEEFSKKLNVKINWIKEKEDLINKIKNGKINKDYVVSRGEYYCALIYSKFLNFNFLDAKNYLIFNKNCKINIKKSKKMLKKLNLTKSYVIGGYYGAKSNGEVCVFDRGGSDITGALICKLLDFEIYENYTDVSGVYDKNRNIFAGAKPQALLCFKTAIQMAEAGNEIVHRDALAEIKNSNCILLVKNTKYPEKLGTIIVDGKINNDSLNICVQKSFIYISKNADKKLINKIKTMSDIKCVFLHCGEYYFILKNIYCDMSKFVDGTGGGKLFEGNIFTFFSNFKIKKEKIKVIKKISKMLKKYNIFYNFNGFLNNYIIICNNFYYETIKKIINQYLQSC